MWLQTYVCFPWFHSLHIIFMDKRRNMYQNIKHFNGHYKHLIFYFMLEFARESWLLTSEETKLRKSQAKGNLPGLGGAVSEFWPKWTIRSTWNWHWERAAPSWCPALRAKPGYYLVLTLSVSQTEELCYLLISHYGCWNFHQHSTHECPSSGMPLVP